MGIFDRFRKDKSQDSSIPSIAIPSGGHGKYAFKGECRRLFEALTSVINEIASRPTYACAAYDGYSLDVDCARGLKLPFEITVKFYDMHHTMEHLIIRPDRSYVSSTVLQPGRSQSDIRDMDDALRQYVLAMAKSLRGYEDYKEITRFRITVNERSPRITLYSDGETLWKETLDIYPVDFSGPRGHQNGMHPVDKRDPEYEATVPKWVLEGGNPPEGEGKSAAELAEIKATLSNYLYDNPELVHGDKVEFGTYDNDFDPTEAVLDVPAHFPAIKEPVSEPSGEMVKFVSHCDNIMTQFAKYLFTTTASSGYECAGYSKCGLMIYLIDSEEYPYAAKLLLDDHYRSSVAIRAEGREGVQVGRLSIIHGRMRDKTDAWMLSGAWYIVDAIPKGLPVVSVSAVMTSSRSLLVVDMADGSQKVYKLPKTSSRAQKALPISKRDLVYEQIVPESVLSLTPKIGRIVKSIHGIKQEFLMIESLVGDLPRESEEFIDLSIYYNYLRDNPELLEGNIEGAQTPVVHAIQRAKLS